MAEDKLIQVLYYKLSGDTVRPEAHFVNARPDDNVLDLREHIAAEEAAERASDVAVWKVSLSSTPELCWHTATLLTHLL